MIVFCDLAQYKYIKILSLPGLNWMKYLLQSKPVNNPVTHSHCHWDPLGRPSNKVWDCVWVSCVIPPVVSFVHVCVHMSSGPTSVALHTCHALVCVYVCVCVGSLIVCCGESTVGHSKARSHSLRGERMLRNLFVSREKKKEKGESRKQQQWGRKCTNTLYCRRREKWKNYAGCWSRSHPQRAHKPTLLTYSMTNTHTQAGSLCISLNEGGYTHTHTQIHN